MDTNFQDKEKVIYYLSVIRDAEVNKPPQEMDKELIDASVGLLLYLQDKNDDLTPEQINDAVEKIPFVDKEKIVNIKNKNKKINKFKLLLIAAIIPIILTILVLMATADIDWSVEDKFQEMFGSILDAPINQNYNDNDIDFGRINGKVYESINDFANDSSIKILVPTEGFTHSDITKIACMSLDTGVEINFAFTDGSLFYNINTNRAITEIPAIQKSSETTINGIKCYIVNLSDVGTYQVYFSHNGYTYHVGGSDLDVITDLINNLEESE